MNNMHKAEQWMEIKGWRQLLRRRTRSADGEVGEMKMIGEKRSDTDVHCDLLPAWNFFM